MSDFKAIYPNSGQNWLCDQLQSVKTLREILKLSFEVKVYTFIMGLVNKLYSDARHNDIHRVEENFKLYKLRLRSTA